MVDPVDPNSIPMLTDVMVPGRPAMGRPAEMSAAAQAQTQPAAEQASPEQATHTPAMADVHPQPAHTPADATVSSPEQAGLVQTSTPAEPLAGVIAEDGVSATLEPPAAARSSDVSAEPALGSKLGSQPAFDARDIEFIAERLRARFSTYLRRDARGVIEAHCRDAIEEHTNWLVRQVTREVLGALEQEVAGWVRDAVSEELARHTSR